MSLETSTLTSPDATREILLIHSAIDGMGICVSLILLRALSSLRRSGEVLPGLLLMVWLMLAAVLFRAVWLSCTWLSRPAPVTLDLLCFVMGYVVLVGVPITVSARYLPKEDQLSVGPGPWVGLQRAMIFIAVVGFSLLLAGVGLRLRSVIFVGPAAVYALTAIFLLGRICFYRHMQIRRRPLLLFGGFMVIGLLTVAFVGSFAIVAHLRVRESMILSSVICAGNVSILCAIIFLFANVRLADVIVKRSMKIVLWTCASLIVWFVVMHSHAIGAGAGHAQQDVVCLLLVCIVIFLAPMAQRMFDEWVDRWVFEKPDLAFAVAALWNKLVSTEDQDDAFLSTETFVRQSLNLAAVRVQPAEMAAGHPRLPDFEPGLNVLLRTSKVSTLLKPPADIVIPLFVDGQADYVMTLSQGPSRPPLTRWEMDFVERIASRLQIWLGLRTAAERARYEASLKEELNSAELRALRAQVNPHFLFNSLNTIADLTVIAPDQAEEMTVRLASVFRYVLISTDRHFTSLKEELEFVSSYLHIEQTRFGDRLKVDFEVDPSTLDQQIPTLLLQPLIENALKHGIAPLRGGGTLTISSSRDHESFLISILDDGVGLYESGLPRERSTGVGVTNVVNRLRTAYGERASFTLRRREQGGTEALIRMPKG